MAYIISFAIEGLAGRSDPFTASLNRDVNVFFGLNGSGKTTLLKILYSALSNNTSILKDLPFDKAEVTIFSNQFKKRFVRSIEQRNIGAAKGFTYTPTSQVSLFRAVENISSTGLLLHDDDVVWALDPRNQPSWESSPTESKDKSLTSYSTSFLPISRLYRNLVTQSGTKRLSDQELDNAFAKGLQAQWSEYYADISREIAKVQERGFANILNFFLSGQAAKTEAGGAPDAEEAYKRISGFLHRQRGFDHLLQSKSEFLEGYAKRQELRNVVQQIDSVENQIANIVAPRERFRAVLESMFTGRKRLIFNEKEIQVELSDKKQIGLSLLSSGEKQLIFIALHALTGGVAPLIVDEPELSMHVDWQKKLISTLRDLNPNIQQIMATHAPEIMADLSDDKVFRL